MNKKIIVTGGLGYIGSHTTIELIQNNFQVVVFDDLSNSSQKTIDLSLIHISEPTRPY